MPLCDSVCFTYSNEQVVDKNIEMNDQRQRQQQSIRTFAILDVEVNNYPQHQFNKCSLTELCIYGISADCLHNDIRKNGRVVNIPPKLPRVLNRINLMINPLRRIHQNTQTGLDNYLLENEAPFNEDTADCIDKFLNRLEKPVCLVAHNGLDHDFRIIRHVYEKVNQEFPRSIFCIDSLDGFRKIDKYLDDCDKQNGDIEMTTRQSKSNELQNTNDNSPEIPTLDEDKTDWQTNNETTPKRAGSNCRPGNAQDNRKLMRRAPEECKNVTKVRRRLQFDTKPYKSYKLGELYTSVFTNTVCDKLHQAEGDVTYLAQLVIHYGKEFKDYADINKQMFDQVRQLGQENVVKKYQRKYKKTLKK